MDWKVEVHGDADGDADGDANIVRGREGGVDKLSELASDKNIIWLQTHPINLLLLIIFGFQKKSGVTKI